VSSLCGSSRGGARRDYFEERIRYVISRSFRAASFLIALSLLPLSAQSLPAVPSGDVRELLAEGLYDRAEAVARDDVARLRVADGDESLEVALASDILVRAAILNGHATQNDTLTFARNALRIKETHLGADHPQLAPSLANLGDVLTAAAEYEEAIAMMRRAVALTERGTELDNLAVADALDHLGSTLSEARRYDDAVKALDRSLAVKENALGDNDPAIARTLEALGLVLQRKGDYERAGQMVRRAAAIQQAGPVDHPAYVGTLNLMAQQLWFEGRLVESKNTSEQAVALAERTLRPDHPNLALSLRYLGATLGDLGNLDESIALKERALAIAEREFGASYFETAHYLYSVSYAALLKGEYVSARERSRRALTIFEKRYGPWHDAVANTVSQLARVDAALGDFAVARKEQARALAIQEHVGGPNHPYVAEALMDLAEVYRETGAPVQALPLLDRALAIRRRSFGPNHREVAWTLSDLALTLTQTGRTTQAQMAARRAVEIWEGLDTPDAPEYATVLALYADLQLRHGDDAAAREYYAKALAIRARVFGTSTPVYADAQARLALALANLGDRESALTNAAAAEAAGRGHLSTMLQSLSERMSLDYAAVRPRALDLMLSLTASTPEAIDVAIDGVIRGRALVLDEMAARQRSQRVASESSDPLRAAFLAAQQRLANLIVRGPEHVSPAQYAAVLDTARRESEQAEQALTERSAEFRAERSRVQLGLDDVMAAVPPGGALVSFVRYERTFFREPVKNPATHRPARPSSRTEPSYLAFVLQANQPPAVVPLGSARPIDSLVSQWRADIAAEGAASQIASGESVRSSRVSGSSLRRLIWDRLTPYLGDATRIFIVPDGALSLVPFVAMPIGQRSYLLDRPQVIHYLSAERDLVSTPADAPTVGQGLLALGGPAFDDATVFASGSNRRTSVRESPASPAAAVRSAGSPCESLQGVRFAPLAGTLQEVQELSHLWSMPEIPEERARVLVGRDASEPTFKKEAHGYRVLHLATHGFFLGDSCSPAPAGTRSVGGLVNASSTRPAATPAENPLLLSGLALAGANRRQSAAPNEDDGILTAEEVASLDLGGVEWAVLSACDTGIGQIKSGEGVFGLRRAFQVAGARTVIMSLWSVDDEATRVWMRALYEGRFQKRLTTADAMRAASAAVLRNRRAKGLSTNPFYWAAFVAVGGWN